MPRSRSFAYSPSVAPLSLTEENMCTREYSLRGPMTWSVRSSPTTLSTSPSAIWALFQELLLGVPVHNAGLPSPLPSLVLSDLPRITAQLPSPAFLLFYAYPSSNILLRPHLLQEAFPNCCSPGSRILEQATWASILALLITNSRILDKFPFSCSPQFLMCKIGISTRTLP